MLKKIIIKTKRALFSEVVGNNTSLFLGEGYDFSELREYQVGDDIRHIDWIITAKLQKPYVKLFHAQRELNIGIIPLLGGSTYFGSHKSKQELIAEVCSIISFSAIKNGDRFYGGVYSSGFEDFITPTKRMFGVYKLVDNILKFNPLNKEVDYKSLTKNISSKTKRRSVLFLVGDFFKDVDLRVLNKRHEVVLIITRDRFEENPKELGYLSLIDPESGERIEGELNKKVIQKYKKEIALNDSRLYKQCRENRIKFTKIYTDENPFIKLSLLFSKK